MIQELHILIGLPGCGKTTWANKFKKEIDNKTKTIFSKVHIIHCDEEWIKPSKNHRFVVVDGIFATQDDVEKCVANLKHFNINDIIVHRWEDDIESCIWNDKGRRKTSSEATIRSLKIVDPKTVRFGFPVKIIEHTVVKKHQCLHLPIPTNAEIAQDKYLISEDWTTGGSYSSWNGSGSLAPEEPVDFVELEEMLLNIDTRFPFLVYKKIWRECVSIEEKTESDYYSTIYKQFYKCDLHKLYQILRDTKLI